MRAHLVVLGGLLATLGPATSRQEPPAQEAAPITAFREQERARIETEIEGAWILTAYQTDQTNVDPRDVRGFATFVDGYMSLVIQGRQVTESMLRGRGLAFRVQGAVFRFRIADNGRFQTSSVFGYTNATEDGGLEFERPDEVREYTMHLEGGELTLERGPIRFTFRKVESTEFSQSALDALDRLHTGGPFVPQRDDG